MKSRRWHAPLSISVLGLTLSATGHARAQYGQVSGYNSFGGYGSIPFSTGSYGTTGYGYFNGFGGPQYSGYSVGNGQVGGVYESTGQLYQQAFQTARPQTTNSLQPLYSAVTSLPGWSGPSRRARRRQRFSHAAAPRARVLDDKGTILWPSTVPSGPAVAESRKAAEAAVRTVVLESKSTGHASVRSVIDAKNKLAAFEKQALPEVRAKNATDAAAFQTFFQDLDQALDSMTLVY